MSEPSDDIEQRLARLRERTEAIVPGRMFPARVMARIDAERLSWLPLNPSLWYRTLPVAVLLATLSAVWAYSNSRAADQQLAVAHEADEQTELDW